MGTTTRNYLRCFLRLSSLRPLLLGVIWGCLLPLSIPIAIVFSLLGQLLPQLNRLAFNFSSSEHWHNSFHTLHGWGTWLTYIALPVVASFLVFGLLDLDRAWAEAGARSDVVVIMAVTIGTSFALASLIVNQLPHIRPPAVHVEWAKTRETAVRDLICSSSSTTDTRIKVTNLDTITYENVQVEAVEPPEVQPRLGASDTIPVLNRTASRKLRLMFEGHVSTKPRFGIKLRITTSTTFGATFCTLYVSRG